MSSTPSFNSTHSLVPSNPNSSVPWRRHVEETLKRNDLRTKQLMEDIRVQLRPFLPQSICTNCGREALQLDMVDMPCGHNQCQDCLSSLMGTQYEYFKKTMTPAVLQRLGVLKGTVLCPKCPHPLVLQRKTVFDEGFARKVFDSRKIVLLEALTKELEKPGVCNICETWENQRRTMFSKYSAANLLTTDHRGAWSTDNGDPIEDKDQKFKLPNMNCAWMYDWTIDRIRSPIDAEGWSYAFNWPGSGIFASHAKWAASAGTMDFVRRRRYHRVWINFTEEVVLKAADYDTSSQNLGSPTKQ
eukprot:PhF_6_TR22343/c0_g1_i1/m.31635